MKKILRGFVVSIVVTAAACSDPAPKAQPTASDNADATLKKTLSAYVVEFLRRNPTTNTYLGGAGLDPSLKEVDGMLRDYSTTALTAEDQWLADTQKTLEGINASRLSANGRIDREVALAQIRFMLHQHQVRKYHERALDTFVGEPFRAIDWQLQGMAQTSENVVGTAEEWTLLVNRVRAIPRYLNTAQAQLEIGVTDNRIPDPRVLLRDGLNTSEANAKYFGETLPKMAEERMGGADRERTLTELRDACKDAAAAYEEFRKFLASTYFESPTSKKVKAAYADDRYAMGEEEYNWALKNNFRVDKTAAQLFDESWPIVQATQTQMVDLAKKIGASHNWKLPEDGPAAVRAVFDQLSKDYPKSDDEMIQWYRDTAFRLVDYGRKSGMFDVPADYKLDVVQTPPSLEASIDGASYYPAPPFKNSGVGRFYVTPTHNDRAALQSNNRAALADLAAHEGFPGHDWHFKVMAAARDQISPVRWLTPGAVEDSSAMWEDSMAAEGWGLYAEALMAEPQPSAPDGFYTPEEHLYQLQGKLYRDLRVRIDTGLHTGRMKYDDAVTLFSEVVDFLPGSCAADAKKSDAKRASCESAERAIFRYSKWPTQAITYRLGKDQIYALREEAAKALGDKFSAKAFHLAFMRQGTVPAGYFHERLLEDLKTRPASGS
ncbi:MAG TPA: DUF885 domain-containing protein [Vicinamibacterales bacterium]